MRVAFVQYRPHPEKDRALDELCELVERVAARSDLVVLPELACTRYLFPNPASARKVAEPAMGDTFGRLAGLAQRHQTWLVCGYVEREGDSLYNSAMVIDASGVLQSSYRKTLLYYADEAWAEPGDGAYRVFDTGNGRFGVGICMDLNDDRLIDWVASERPDVLAFPTNWLDEGDDVWGYWSERMRGLNTTLVAANSWGREEAVGFSGRSCILFADQVLASAHLQGNAVGRAKVPVGAQRK
jgi:predicted amidohydrolase